MVVPDPLMQIPQSLGYKKAGRLRALPVESQHEILFEALKNSIRGTYAILFFPAAMIQITPYGLSSSMKMAQSDDDHFLIMYPQLKCEYLREVFTSLEMLLFKIAHIFSYEQLASYRFESEKTIRRFKALRNLLDLDDWASFQSLFDEIWFVRDAFAHSFIDIKSIKFRGEALEDCFGYGYLGKSYNKCNFSFVADLKNLFDPIIRLFMRRQFEQIDTEKLAALCDAAIIPRTLGR